MDNQQLNLLTIEQKQVFYTALLGDGCIATSNSGSTYYVTNSIHKEYINYKSFLLGDLSKNISYLEKNGYSQTLIWILRSKSLKILKTIKISPLNVILDGLDELGLALWFYDDGSRHKTKNFYNLNTHKFSREVQEDILIPYFNKLGMYPVLARDLKKNGKCYWYLRFGVRKGAYLINEILEKYLISCFSYKRMSSETIL